MRVFGKVPPSGTLSVVVEAPLGTAGPFPAWTLQVTPGPPTAVTAISGDREQTGKGHPFTKQLAATLTDAGGNPITGAPVTFKVTSGEATFPLGNVRFLAALTGQQSFFHVRLPPRDSVTLSTDDKGVATAPVLTAGPNAGQIVVSASADGAAPTVKPAVFNLSATAVAPTPPKIDSLTNSDGQVTVSFSGASAGTSPITSYEVSAENQTTTTGVDTVTAKGESSPIVVKGLINGDTYHVSPAQDSRRWVHADPPRRAPGDHRPGRAPLTTEQRTRKGPASRVDELDTR